MAKQSKKKVTAKKHTAKAKPSLKNKSSVKAKSGSNPKSSAKTSIRSQPPKRSIGKVAAKSSAKATTKKSSAAKSSSQKNIIPRKAASKASATNKAASSQKKIKSSGKGKHIVAVKKKSSKNSTASTVAKVGAAALGAAAIGVAAANTLRGSKKEASLNTMDSKKGSKNAPKVKLSVNDGEVLSSAKEHFGNKDLNIFKKILQEQRTEASEEFDIISQQMMDTSGEFDSDNQAYSLHTAEQGTDAMEREKTFLHAQRTSDYIKKLDEALERIDRGTYGICVICGKLIEKQRLAAVPITQKHVDCKNKTQMKKLTVEAPFHEMEENGQNE